MMRYVARLKADPINRVVMHCHPANLLAMTFVHTLDEREPSFLSPKGLPAKSLCLSVASYSCAIYA